MSDTPQNLMAERTLSSESLAGHFQQHAEGLRRFVFGVVRDREAADDVVQVTFAKAAQDGKVQADAIKPWLYRVAFNEAVTWKRRQAVDRKAKLVLGHRTRSQSDDAAIEPLVREELVEMARVAVQGLPENQRRVVQARIYEEKTFAQIGAELGMPLGTVLTHMRRAIEKLRQKLNRDE